jgi:hypothetical protein
LKPTKFEIDTRPAVKNVFMYEERKTEPVRLTAHKKNKTQELMDLKKQAV